MLSSIEINILIFLIGILVGVCFFIYLLFKWTQKMFLSMSEEYVELDLTGREKSIWKKKQKK